MFGRRTRTRLPVSSTLLESPSAKSAHQGLEKSKVTQATYYNRTARTKPELSIGQTVRAKFMDAWRKAEVVKILPHRAYEVRLEDGSTRRRTSRHLRSSPESPIVIKSEPLDDEHPVAIPGPSCARTTTAPPAFSGVDEDQPSPGNEQSENSLPSDRAITRSGRTVRLPTRYREYQLTARNHQPRTIKPQAFTCVLYGITVYGCRN
jgi:hypothetical protein